jgi:two-component system, chemotaxis family, protein-glutamate methylesterase/glutaminase
MSKEKIKLLIIDDSETVRTFLTKIISQTEDIRIIESVGDAHKAAPLIVKTKPDVVTLDITMPGIDGLTFLEKLMKNYPTPVVMFSSYTSEGTYATETALRLGAVDYLAKPLTSSFEEYKNISDILIKKIKDASKKKVSKIDTSINYSTIKKKITNEIKKIRDNIIRNYGEALESTNKIILIGSSTGGTEALSKILNKFPSKIPPIVIVQHMPTNYTKAWAGRLNSIYDFDVLEAEEGMEIKRNNVYIAPGGKHIEIKTAGNNSYITIKESPPVNSCKPSVDVLFKSINNEETAKKIIAILLTGMGKDGAEGMFKLKELGSITIAQDKDSCLIYGMPKAAMDMNAVMIESNLDDMPYKILENL